MKRLLLPACFAAAAASAAELKQHDEVVREWRDIVDQPVPALTGDLSLRGTVAATQSARSIKELRESSSLTPGRSISRPRPSLDAPAFPPPRHPETRPPGAKPYLFEGRTYWLVPLADPQVS